MGMLYYISFVFYILLVKLDSTFSASVDYMTEGKAECHFVNGTQEVQYLERYFYNREEFLYFDSREGKFIAKTELGRTNADAWNKDPDRIAYMKSTVETYCIPNYKVFERAGAMGRRVEPELVVSLLPHEDSSTTRHILQCNVFGFYPSEIEVKWYRNGQEETEQVQSSALLRNGDWTYQILVMLVTDIEKGDTFTCEVHHVSLKAPHRVDWHPQTSDSAKNKIATGIVGFVLGSVFFIAGIWIWMRGRKVQTSFRGPQTEHFIHT